MPNANVPSTANHYADIECLDDVEMLFNEEISNYEIVSSENLYDEDNGRVYRVFNFNRGIKDCFVVIHPDFLIKAVSPTMPTALLVQIANLLVGATYQIFGEILSDE